MKRLLSASLALTALLVSVAAVAQHKDSGVEGGAEDANRGLGGTRLGVDLDYASGVGRNGTDSGVGGALRLGHEYDLLLVSLTPELMGTLHDFSGPSDPLVFSGMGGGRLTLGKVIEPGVFAHVGVGHASMPLDSRTGLAFDLGATVDLTLIPAVDLGVHGAYDLVAWQRVSYDWFRAGAHVVFAP
jgi:hypothetical protein